MQSPTNTAAAAATTAGVVNGAAGPSSNGKAANGAAHAVTAAASAAQAGPSSPTSASTAIKAEAQTPAPVLVAGEELARAASTYGLSERALAKSKARQAYDVPQHVLEAELLPETEALIPIGAIVARLANHGYEALQNLSETLPSLSSAERRTAIFQTSLDVRAQLIKLLVLVQWSKSAPELSLARNLIGLVCAQFAQTQDAVEAIGQVRSLLPSARIRNADLVSAIDVLATGTYDRLPSAIKDSVVPPKRFDDAQALDIVHELDAALRLRLACDEVVPLPMSDYSVEAGRATFKVQGLFNAQFTISGDESADQSRWFLLNVKFDFRITGAGVELFPRRPKKNARLALLQQTDAELAPRSVAVAPEDAKGQLSVPQLSVEGDDVAMLSPDAKPHPHGADEGPIKVRRDAPLVRAFNFLQSQALEYQLDILNYQALQLAQLGWAPTLAAGFEPILRAGDARTLVVSYWRGRVDSSSSSVAEKPSSFRPGSNDWNPVAGASIRLRVRERPRKSTRAALLARLMCNDVVAGEATSGQGLKDQELSVEWVVEERVEALLGDTKLRVDAYNLDMETLLLSAVTRHAQAAISELKTRILASPLGRILPAAACSISSASAHGRPSQVLRLPLHEKLTLLLRVDTKSGRLSLEADEAEPSHVAPHRLAAVTLARDAASQRLREASAAINENPRSLVEVLQTQRRLAILEDLEHKATYLGLPCTRRMPLRQVEYTKLSAKQGSMLYVPLVQCPNYYLVLHIGEQALRVALMCAGTFVEGMLTVMGVHSVEWLDRARIAKGARESTLGKRKEGEQEAQPKAAELNISIEELSRLHCYSVALVCYHQIEQQLRARALPFVHIGTPTSAPAPPLPRTSTLSASDAAVISIVPSLCLRAAPLLGTSSALVKNNVLVRLCEWWDRSTCRVELTVRLRNPLGMQSRVIQLASTGDTLTFDQPTSALTFSTRVIGDCVARFLSEWNRVSRITMLARDVERAGRTPACAGLQLKTFDLEHVVFAYDKGLAASIRWQQDPTQLRGSCYVLQLTHEEQEARNPHALVQASLQRMLNGPHDGTPEFWPCFLQLLHDTLPVLRIIAPFTQTCLSDPDCPEVEVRSATWLRLHFLGRHVLDVRFLRGSKVLFADGAFPLTLPLSGLDSLSALEAGGADKAASEAFAPKLQANPPIPNFEALSSQVVKAVLQGASAPKAARQAVGQGASGALAAAARLPLVHLGRAILCNCAENVASNTLTQLLNAIRQQLSA